MRFLTLLLLYSSFYQSESYTKAFFQGLKPIKNKCNLHDGYCSYQVILTGSECVLQKNTGMRMVRDAPKREKKDEMVSKDIIKRLDNFEAKFTKMLENLSVRNLRHSRQIKSDLRDLQESIDKLNNGNKKFSRKRHKKRSLSRCPFEFRKFGKSKNCYKFSSFNTNWKKAKEYCTAFGANLLSIESIGEDYVIDYQLRSNLGLVSNILSCLILYYLKFIKGQQV